MTMSDPIADMLTRIRNANTAKHDTVDVPASKMKLAIVQILLDEGYIKKYDILDEGSFKTIHITLKYGEDKNDKIISGIKRISKPGLVRKSFPAYWAVLVSQSFPPTRVLLPIRKQESCRLAAKFWLTSGKKMKSNSKMTKYVI
jgi:hypothetical protein